MSTISRRSALTRLGLVGAAGAGIALGFLRPVHKKVALPPPPPPAALVAALAAHSRLAAGYRQAADENPDRADLLSALGSDVTAQLQAITAVLERYPGWRYEQTSPTPHPVGTYVTTPFPTPSPRPPIPSGTQALAQACDQTASALAAACVAWPAGEPNAADVVPLLGSISASVASHAVMLV